MKRFAFSCTFLFCSLLLFAQSNFIPGSITKSAGESINGFIDYKEWSKNPSTISFKKSLDEAATAYSVDDLLGFEVTGKEKYLRARIKKDMMPVKISELKVVPSVKLETVTAFVRELFRNDRIGLYIYRDFKDHFYVSATKDEFVELVYGVSESDGDIFESNIFRDQLLTYFPELRSDAKVTRKLEGLKYKEADLVGFFYTATNTKAKKTEKIKPVIFAGTGVVISPFEITGDHDVAALDYKTSVTPVLYAGVDIMTKRNHGAFVIRPQASYFNLNYEGSQIRNHPAGYQEEVKYVLKSSNFNISLGGLYNFWNKPKQKVYAGAEVVVNFSSYKENEITRQNLSTGSITTDWHLLQYEKTWLTVNAMAGAVFMKHFEVSATVKLTGSMSTMQTINVKPTIYVLRLGYRF